MNKKNVLANVRLVVFLKLLLLSLIILPAAEANEGAEPATVPAAAVSESSGGDIATNGSAIETDESVEEFRYPEIPPQISVSAGYRFVSHRGSERSDEYQYFHDSVTLGGELKAYPFPHRIHLDLDFINQKDYYADLLYTYKDLVLFRGINATIFHNLENIELVDLDPSTTSPGILRLDDGKRYGIKVGMSNFLLRFKTPNYPLHLYIDGFVVTKDGTQQLLRVDDTGTIRISQPRDVDLVTTNITLGANAHVGPIEVDFSHGEKRLTVSGDNVFYDSFRGSGLFQNNLLPELRGSSNTIKLHTSYTGKLVATATFSQMRRENDFSGAKADYFVGAGEIVWTASPEIAVFLRYRHRETDTDNPSSVTVTDRTNPINTYTFSVKQSISSTSDKASGTVRYLLAPGIVLRAEYSYTDVRRVNADEWNLPESTQTHQASLTADIRLYRGLNLKAKYTHTASDDPGYNIDPYNSDQGLLSVSWSPVARLNAFLSYQIDRENRNELVFTDTSSAHDRDLRRDGILAGATYLITDTLSCTGSYYHMTRKILQDIAYRDAVFAVQVDKGVSDKDSVDSYSLSLDYVSRAALDLGTSVTLTKSSGSFHPSDANLTDPVSIASFSTLGVREIIYAFSGRYRFKNGYSAGIDYKFADIRDTADNPYDDITNSSAHIVLLTLSKKW